MTLAGAVSGGRSVSRGVGTSPQWARVKPNNLRKQCDPQQNSASHCTCNALFYLQKMVERMGIEPTTFALLTRRLIGRASCRVSLCQYLYFSLFSVLLPHNIFHLFFYYLF